MFKLIKRQRLVFSSTKRYYSQLLSGYAKVNNVDLYYETTGESKAALLCMPGALGSCQSDFSYQLSGLAEHFKVVAFDPRGYGKSQKPRVFSKNFFNVDADDGVMLMQQLGHDKFSVLGWSDGGIAGLILAGKYQQHVRNLIVLGASAYVTQKDIDLIEATRDLSKWSERMRKPLEDIYGADGLKQIWNEWMDCYISFSENPDGNICIDSLACIKCPTLVVQGNKDALVPNFQAEFLRDNIKNAKYLLVPDGKHNLHLKYNQAFNHLVTKFIQQGKVEFSV